MTKNKKRKIIEDGSDIVVLTTKQKGNKNSRKKKVETIADKIKQIQSSLNDQVNLDSYYCVYVILGPCYPSQISKSGYTSSEDEEAIRRLQENQE